jgi:6-pyruvoyl-tetrahydropterin synthase
MDFAELDALVTPLVLARLDHSYLNDVCEGTVG